MQKITGFKRKMNCILFLVLFMTALICMSGALQTEINDQNNRPDRAPVEEVEYENVEEEIEMIEMIEISKPKQLYLLMSL